MYFQKGLKCTTLCTFFNVFCCRMHLLLNYAGYTAYFPKILCMIVVMIKDLRFSPEKVLQCDMAA